MKATVSINGGQAFTPCALPRFQLAFDRLFVMMVKIFNEQRGE
jgi:hypothetical protein